MAAIYGISFPFRIGVKGGVVMSQTDAIDSQHLVESIQQILLTGPRQRTMEYQIYSNISNRIFDVNDASTHTLIEYEIAEALKIEDRIQVESVTVYLEDERPNELRARIVFTVLATAISTTADVRVGEIDGETA